MSTAAAVRARIQDMPRGRPFTSSSFIVLGPRGAVDRALSRIVHEGEIERLARGVFVRPRKNRFVGKVFPGVGDVVRAIAKDSGETVQVHGAEAARRFGLTTQAPTTPRVPYQRVKSRHQNWQCLGAADPHGEPSSASIRRHPCGTCPRCPLVSRQESCDPGDGGQDEDRAAAR